MLFICRAVVDFQDQMHMVRHDDKTINIGFGIVFRQSLDQTLYRQPKLIQNAVLTDDGTKQTLVFKYLKRDEEPPEAVVDLTVSKLWPTIFAINHRHCKSPSSLGARALPLASSWGAGPSRPASSRGARASLLAQSPSSRQHHSLINPQSDIVSPIDTVNSSATASTLMGSLQP